MLGRDASYKKSQQILTVDFYISNQARYFARDVRESKETVSRQAASQALADELAALAGVPEVTVKISDKKQWHKRSGGKITFRQYGYYKPGSSYIYITNRTAARGQLLAGKTFLDTLLHEWLHHYDYVHLNIDSYHTKGFYARLKDLKEKIGYFRD